MDARDAPASQLDRAAPDLVVVHAPEPPAHDLPVVVVSPPPATPGSSRLRRAVLLGVAAGFVLVLVVGGWLLLRGGGDAGTASAPGSPRPAGVGPLTLRVDVPARVVAGVPATLVVHYDDGAGVFSGSTEEWGDEVGTSSLRESTCPTANVPADPASGSYQAAHTWAEPGTYPVEVGVSTYTCVDGAPVEEQATTTVDVVVAAP